MTWVKLDDAFADHPKIVGLADRAFRVHVRALCYCGRFSPGVGAIPESALRQLGAVPSVVKELLEAGVWEEDGDHGELYIHDFAVYHPAQNKEAKAEAGRRGGIASGEARRKQKEAECFDSASGLVEPKRTPVPVPVPSGSNEPDLPRKRAPKRSREFSEEFLARMAAQYPAVDVPALADDYLNWSGSKNHVDIERGLQSQLRLEWKREQFAKTPAFAAATVPPPRPVSQLRSAEEMFPDLPKRDTPAWEVYVAALEAGAEPAEARIKAGMPK